MGFTFKAYNAARKQRTVKNSASDKQAMFAAPTVKAGPKNSNGPKGGSSKSSVPANRTYLKTNNKGKPPKVAKVTKASLRPKSTYQSATPGVNRVSNNAGRKTRSSRVNYRQLRSK